MKRIVLLVFVGMSACSSSSNNPTSSAGGPIDGQYKLTGHRCDGVETPTAPFVFTVNNASGSFVLTFSDSCVATLKESYTYPSAGKITIVSESPTCSPGSGCPALFGGASCVPSLPAATFDYALAGNTLTFQSTALGPPADTCAKGQAEVYAMTKQ